MNVALASAFRVYHTTLFPLVIYNIACVPFVVKPLFTVEVGMDIIGAIDVGCTDCIDCFAAIASMTATLVLGLIAFISSFIVIFSWTTLTVDWVSSIGASVEPPST